MHCSQYINSLQLTTPGEQQRTELEGVISKCNSRQVYFFTWAVRQVKTHHFWLQIHLCVMLKLTSCASFAHPAEANKQ